MRLFLFSILIFSWGITSPLSFALNWEGKLQSILPSPLNQFKIGKTNLKEVESKIGKAHLVEGSKNYWEKDGLKYALVLNFKNKTLKSISYTFTKNKPSLDLFRNELKSAKLISKESKYLILKNKTSALMIDPISKTVYSVRFP